MFGNKPDPVAPPFSGYLVASVYPLTLNLALLTVVLFLWAGVPFCDFRPAVEDLPLLPGASLVGGGEDLYIAVLSPGNCAILALRLPCSELEAKLRQFRPRAPSGGIVLRASRHLPYREVAAVCARLRDAGFDRVILESNRAAVLAAGRPSTSH